MSLRRVLRLVERPQYGDDCDRDRYERREVAGAKIFPRMDHRSTRADDTQGSNTPCSRRQMIRCLVTKNLDKLLAVSYPRCMRKQWSQRLAIACVAALFSLQIHALVHEADAVGTTESAESCDVCAVARVATASVTHANAPAFVPVLATGQTVGNVPDAPRSPLEAERIPSPRGPPTH